jgi:hypothetical protein
MNSTLTTERKLILMETSSRVSPKMARQAVKDSFSSGKIISKNHLKETGC